VVGFFVGPCCKAPRRSLGGFGGGVFCIEKRGEEPDQPLWFARVRLVVSREKLENKAPRFVLSPKYWGSTPSSWAWKFCSSAGVFGGGTGSNGLGVLAFGKTLKPVKRTNNIPVDGLVHGKLSKLLGGVKKKGCNPKGGIFGGFPGE